MKIIADTHTHTIASTHAYGTIIENATQAKTNGMEFIAVTDHGPSLPDSPHEWHFLNLRVLPKVIDGIRVLSGVEANIMSTNGALDLDQEILKRLEWVIAGFHEPVYPPTTIADHTEAYLNVAKNKAVDVIGHSGNPNFPYEYEKCIKTFGECGKIVELNENSFDVRTNSDKNCLEIAKLCKKHNVRVIINSDAHFPTAIGVAPRTIAMLKDIDFPKELVINADRDRFSDYLKTRGVLI